MNINTLADEASHVGPSCALLTPPGRGAIATIGVRGAGALAAVARCFQPASGEPLGSIPPGRVVFGRFQSPSGAAEELVVGVVSAEQIEVHCHGGTAAAEAVVAALASAGSQVETWRERIAAETRDLIAAAALAALAEARTERTAAILLNQYHGALRRELSQIGDLITDNSRQALERLQLLLNRSDLGRHLTRPWRVVLTGAPNVGKSSLINALLGYQRAIVFDQPGTTRDVLTATTAIDGWPVELSDTAGLREGGDAVESEGVARALTQVAAADLVAEVLDATEDGSQESGVRSRETADYSQLTHHQSRLVVHNKCDLLSNPRQLSRPGLLLSAKTGEGMDSLIAAISQRLVPSPPAPGSALPFTDSQVLALQQAIDFLDCGKVNAAQQVIQSLLALNPEP